MKNYIKNAVALLLLVVFLLSSNLTVIAAGQPSSYSSTSNSGERGVVCTSLKGTGAEDYYTGDYSYENLSSMSQSFLLSSLRKLMTETLTRESSYDTCKTMAPKTDCENNDGRIVMLYTSYSGSYSEYNSGNGWNREHVWPKSLGGFETEGPGADLHHIRPTENQTNSKRGNSKYGYANGSIVTGNLSGLVGGTLASYYEPLDNVKGDVARICLYIYVTYGGSYTKCSSVTNVFQSVDVLLEWCALDPVDTWEMGRNEVVEAYQGNRNVFIDYPELAWAIYGKTAPADMVTPSGNGGNSGNENGSSSGSENTDIDVEGLVATLDSEAEKLLILLALGVSNSLCLNEITN